MEPKFNLDRPKISDEEINSNKDFGELVNKFKKQSIEKARSDQSFLKNKKATYSAIIAGVTVICTVTYFTVFKKQPPKETTNDKIITIHKNTSTTTPSETKLNKAFIAPPISKLNVPYTSYNVKAEQGATIKHKSQSKIIIPKKAFVNKQGQDIVGDVEIRYREFHDQADIIASGIPMTYDSAGIKSHFESAGMIDIRGYQNGEPVYINPKKQITVEMASKYTEDKYNMYALDTIAKNWSYIGRDNSLKNTKSQNKNSIKEHAINKEELTSELTKELQKKIDEIPPKIEKEKTIYTTKVNQLPQTVQPLKPNKSVAGRPQFQLDVNYKEFPELAAFKNAVFEVGTENKNYSNELADITWGSAEVSEGPQKGKNYLLTLKLKQRVEKLIVYPALTGADYEKALSSYENKFAEYKKLQAKREADEQKLKEEFEAKQAAYVAQQQKYLADISKEQIRLAQQKQTELAEKFATLGNEERVTRVFLVSNFGIFNSDCPKGMPNGASLDPVYLVNGSAISPAYVNLVCHNRNIVYRLEYGKLNYNPSEQFSICIVQKGKMYLCDKATFAGITTSKQNKIPLKELNADVDNIVDFKKALGI